MSTLNYGRSYGVISPPLNGAVFEQNGEYYDVLNNLLQKDAAGLPIESEQSVEEVDPDTLPSAHELLQNVEKMPFFKWKAHAKRILGQDSPGNKTGLVEMLKLVRNNQAGVHRAPTPLANNETSTNGEGKQDLDPAKTGEIDLRSWATGETKCLMAQVSKALRERYPGTRISTMRDAIDFLISQGVVTSEEAMKVE